MAWRDRAIVAGWFVFGAYVWVTEPELTAKVLLVILVAAMLVLSVVALGVRAKRKRRT
jgi:hypothetical protein